MIYSQLKTGKVKCEPHHRYPQGTSKRDIAFIEKILSLPSTSVFSIPELAQPEDVPKESVSVRDLIRELYGGTGISLMPPYNVTWWEAPLYWRYADVNSSRPGICISVYVSLSSSPKVVHMDDRMDDRMNALLKQQGWHGMLTIMPAFLYDQRLSPLCSHLFIGLDKDGAFQDVVIRAPADDVYYEKMAQSFSRDTGHEVDATLARDIEWTLAETAACACLPVLKALALLNCKNISTDEHLFHTPRKKKGKRGPLVRAVYRTLKLIVPGKRSAPRHHPTEDDPAGRAFHMVRGHFAIYEEGHGLFGKYPGRYWIPAHTRGSKDMGIVRKKYELEVTK